MQTLAVVSDKPQLAIPSELSLKFERGYSLASLEIESKPVEYIAGMFPKGKVSALVGESGKGKGWVLPAAALTITSSTDFLPTDNYEVRSDGKVMIVDTEGRIKTYKQRILELGGKLENFMLPDEPSRILGFNPHDRARIAEVIQIDKPDFVIFDSFAGFIDVDENSSEVIPVLKWFTELALKHNVAVTFTQLVNKSEIKDGRLTIKSVRGFSGIPQFPEIVWAIDTPDSSDDRTKRLYQIKNNIEQKDNVDYVFTLDKSKITFTGEIIERQQDKIARRKEIREANLDKSPQEIAKLIQEIEPDAKLNSLTKWVMNQK